MTENEFLDGIHKQAERAVSQNSGRRAAPKLARSDAGSTVGPPPGNPNVGPDGQPIVQGGPDGYVDPRVDFTAAQAQAQANTQAQIAAQQAALAEDPNAPEDQSHGAAPVGLANDPTVGYVAPTPKGPALPVPGYTPGDKAPAVTPNAAAPDAGGMPDFGAAPDVGTSAEAATGVTDAPSGPAPVGSRHPSMIAPEPSGAGKLLSAAALLGLAWWLA